jgi:hypothetical protein
MKEALGMEDTAAPVGIEPSPPNGGFDHGLNFSIDPQMGLVESGHRMERTIQ